MGIGNGFLSPVDQSVYADVYSKLGYVTAEEERELRQFDEKTLKAHSEGRMVDAIHSSQASLHTFASQIMNLTNIYDFTFDENYLTNHEYICYLQRPYVRR